MRVLIAHHTKIPVTGYGGTERIMWWLGNELVQLGHKVTFLVNKGSKCPFAQVLRYNPRLSLNDQIPQATDIVHLFFQPREVIAWPYLITQQGNVPDEDKLKPLDPNTVFVSGNHAKRHQSTCFVYNGIDPLVYGNPPLDNIRHYYHFLAKTSWAAKNLKGAIEVVECANQKLYVMGGGRLNSKVRFQQTFNRNIKFYGMARDRLKRKVLGHSRGLVFPVLWNEPFGIAIIESLYFGCPVFGTTYGSLPEIISKDIGFLSNSVSELSNAILDHEFSPKHCHEVVMEQFTCARMTGQYLSLYEQVLAGRSISETQPTAKFTMNEHFPDSLDP